MIFNIIEDFFEINTFESYSKDIYVVNDNIIIPYINIEVFMINFYSRLKNGDKLNFSYLIFTGMKEMQWKYNLDGKVTCNKLVVDNFSNKNYLVDQIEVTNVFSKYGGYDFEIRYKEQYLYFSNNVKVKNGALNFWVPIDTPNFKRNMDEENVELFFDKSSVPPEVLKLIDIKSTAELKTLDISKSININL